MGQCYSVVVHLEYNDPEPLIQILQDEISKRQLKQNYNIIDPLERGLKVFLTENAYFDDKEDCWIADFDASYSWESVLIKVFGMLVLECKGSWVEISPDNDSYFINNITYNHKGTLMQVKEDIPTL